MNFDWVILVTSLKYSSLIGQNFVCVAKVREEAAQQSEGHVALRAPSCATAAAAQFSAEFFFVLVACTLGVRRRVFAITSSKLAILVGWFTTYFTSIE